ncbi:MAG: hypothetical protein AB7F59_07870 [Bdellovibrionales bacterium]
MGSSLQKLIATVKVFLLFLTAVVTVATSKTPENSETKPSPLGLTRHYLVASSCLGAIPEEEIEVQGYLITSPTDVDFRRYGLPNEFLDVGVDTQTTGLVNNRTRECQYTKTTDGDVDIDVYTCYEIGYLVCRVSFERNG